MSEAVRSFVRYFVSIVFLSAVLGFSGCEKSGGGHISDGFDFGDNDSGFYVAMGNSITAGCCLESMALAYPNKLSGLLGKEVENFGVPGSRSSYGAGNVHAVLNAYKPGYLLILYGINDLIHGQSSDSILANLRIMISAAKANRTIPVVATLTPVFGRYAALENRVADVNAGIRLLAAEENVHVADISHAFRRNTEYMDPDGLHPNSAGHDVMAETFYAILK